MKKSEKKTEKIIAKEAQDVFDKIAKGPNDSLRSGMKEAADSLDQKKDLRKIEPFNDAHHKAKKYGGTIDDYDKVKTNTFSRVQEHAVHDKLNGTMLERKFAYLDARDNARDINKKIEKTEKKIKRL
jgi:hypothetical protein